jgi:hypothetical protein
MKKKEREDILKILDNFDVEKWLQSEEGQKAMEKADYKRRHALDDAWKIRFTI